MPHRTICCEDAAKVVLETLDAKDRLRVGVALPAGQRRRVAVLSLHGSLSFERPGPTHLPADDREPTRVA